MVLGSLDTFPGLPPLAVTGLVVLFLFLPGHLLWKLLTVRSEKFRQFCQEEYGFSTALLAQMAISVLVTGWAGFVLGETGLFDIWILASIVGAVCVVLLAIGNPMKMWRIRGYRRAEIRGMVKGALEKGRTRTPVEFIRQMFRIAKDSINYVLLRNEILYIPALIVVAVFMFTEPVQNVWRGRRDTAETLCALRLARHGSFTVKEKLLSEISPDEKKELFFEGNVKKGSKRYMRFPSYFSMTGPDSDSTYPAFLHFFSTWLGISCVLVGVPMFYYITPVLAIISIGVIFLFVRSLSSIKTAFLAVLLLTLNITQAYFVRFSSSVIAAQLFVFAGLYFFTVFSRTSLRTFGILSGIAFGQAVLCGNGLFHYFILAGFLAFCAAYSPRRRPRILHRYAIVPFFLFLAQAVLFDAIAGTDNLVIFAESLTRKIMGPLMFEAWEPHLATSLKIGGLFTGVLLAISMAFFVRKKRAPGPVTRFISYRKGIVINVLGYLIAAFYIIWFYSTRPPYLSYDGGIVYPNKWIHKFIDELGLLFLLVGVGFFIYFRFVRKRQHMVYFPMFLFLIFALENVWNPDTSSRLLYGFGKFIPIFLPFAYFMVAYSLFAFRELTRDLEFGRYFGGTIAIAAISLILLTGQKGLLLKAKAGGKDISEDVFREYRENVVERLERAQIPAADSVFLFAPGPSDPSVPMTLTYVYGIECVQLNEGPFGKESITAIVEGLIDSKRHVFLVVESGEQVKAPVVGQFRTILFGRTEISIPRLEETRGERIRNVIEKGRYPTVLTLYRVVREI